MAQKKKGQEKDMRADNRGESEVSTLRQGTFFS